MVTAVSLVLYNVVQIVENVVLARMGMHPRQSAPDVPTQGTVRPRRRMPQRSGLGTHIRRLRRSRGDTLVQLAERTDLSHPFLSQLERGLAQPSLSSLRRIAVALGTSPIELVAAAEDTADPTSDPPAVEVRRGGDAAPGVAGFAEGSARLLAHSDRPFHPLEYASDNDSPGDYYEHAEDEFLYVTSGSVVVDLDGRLELLETGDSVYYAAGSATGGGRRPARTACSSSRSGRTGSAPHGRRERASPEHQVRSASSRLPRADASATTRPSTLVRSSSSTTARPGAVEDGASGRRSVCGVELHRGQTSPVYWRHAGPASGASSCVTDAWMSPYGRSSAWNTSLSLSMPKRARS